QCSRGGPPDRASSAEIRASRVGRCKKGTIRRTITYDKEIENVQELDRGNDVDGDSARRAGVRWSTEDLPGDGPRARSDQRHDRGQEGERPLGDRAQRRNQGDRRPQGRLDRDHPVPDDRGERRGQGGEGSGGEEGEEGVRSPLPLPPSPVRAPAHPPRTGEGE